MLIIEDISTGERAVINEAYTRQELKDMLAKDPVLISFRKVTNNRYRLLFGTRDLSKIPAQFHPNGIGLRFNPEEKDLIPVFDLVKNKWRSFKVKRVRRAEVKSVQFLRRLLQSRKIADRLRVRKYRTDSETPQDDNVETRQEQFRAANGIVLEAVSIPVFMEDKMLIPLNESNDKFFKRVLRWISARQQVAVEAARKAARVLSGEFGHAMNIPAKVIAKYEVIRKYLFHVTTGRAVSADLEKKAKTALKEFLHYLGLGAIAFFPSPPGVSILLVGLLRVLERVTSIPIFPKSWEEDPEETQRRFEIDEMAAGALGQGSSSANTPDIFMSNVRKAIARINMSLSRDKLTKLGTLKGMGDIYMLGNGFGGDLFAFSKRGSIDELLEDPESIVFTAQYFVEEEFEDVTGRAPVTIQHPYTKPELTGKGIAFQVYKMMGQEEDIIADGVQSKEGRFLWAKLVRERAFRFVYVYDQSYGGIEGEISGDFDEFRRIMAEGDDSVRFIGSARHA